MELNFIKQFLGLVVLLTSFETWLFILDMVNTFLEHITKKTEETTLSEKIKLLEKNINSLKKHDNPDMPQTSSARPQAVIDRLRNLTVSDFSSDYTDEDNEKYLNEMLANTRLPPVSTFRFRDISQADKKN